MAERIKLAIAYDLYYNQMKKLAIYKNEVEDLSTTDTDDTHTRQIDYEKTKDAFSMQSILEQAQVLHDHCYIYGP